MNKTQLSEIKSRIDASLNDDLRAVVDALESSQRENERLRLALEWYGDEGNYEDAHGAPINASAIGSDGGARAREALGDN